MLDLVAETIGLSSILTLLRSNPFIWDSTKLVILGLIVETGRRIFYWVIERFRLRLSISAEFNSGNQAHEWIVSFLTKENVWLKSRDFLVESKTSQRKWSILSTGPEQEHVDYIPAYGSVHFFRWRGYWLEVRRGRESYSFVDDSDGGRYRNTYPLYLTLYTLDMSVLFAFVEECRSRFVENSKPSVTVYSTDASNGYGGPPTKFWNNAKTKLRRPIDSVVLVPGVIESLLADAREFFDMEDWYIKAGIPHRRGYLLYGPPGTGKTSTVYAAAGQLDLDIYTLSLASSKIDDDALVQAISLLPPRCILLIEDIDCAFPSRDDEEEMGLGNGQHALNRRPDTPKSQVTLSGLLNVLDGVGSEEGKLFFATTNHIDRLDPALLRPGRIDRKIEYMLASREQARSLFNRFFPPSSAPKSSDDKTPEHPEAKHADELADEFASKIPVHEFSTAELQGYLLDWKLNPSGAARGVHEWVEREREVKHAREERERLRKEKVEETRIKEQLKANEAMIVGIGTAMAKGRKSRRRRRRSSISSSEDSTSDDSKAGSVRKDLEEGNDKLEASEPSRAIAEDDRPPTPRPKPEA